jgi:hypothetical protein
MNAALTGRVSPEDEFYVGKILSDLASRVYVETANEFLESLLTKSRKDAKQ